MKHYLFFTSIIFLFSCTGHSQKVSDSENGLYLFNSRYLNLDDFNNVMPNSDTAFAFKKSGKYAGRFMVPGWSVPYQTKIRYRDKDFLIYNNTQVKMVDPASGKEIVINSHKPKSKPENVTGNNFLIGTVAGVAHIVAYPNDYEVCVFDETGKEQKSYKIEHTALVTKGNTVYSYPYLSYLAHTKQMIVFTSYDRNYPKTVVIDLLKGETKSYSYSVIGLIRDMDEKSLVGFIKTDEDKKQIRIIKLSGGPEVVLDNSNSDNATETILKNDTLIMATYHSIATGSALAAYSYQTGKRIWKAEVKQMNVGHSEYYNTVFLSMYKNRLIMEGVEAAGSYLQVFDFSSGKRLFISGL